MKLIQIVNAQRFLCEMYDSRLDYGSAHRLAMLKAKIKPHLEFYAEEEMKLVKQYARKDEKGEIIWKPDGRFDFETDTGFVDFSVARGKLGDIDVDIEPVSIAPPPSLTANMIEALEGLVIFDGE